MPIAFTCPHCQAARRIDESYAGQSGPCAHCGATVTVPLRGGAARGGGRSSSTATILVLVVAVGGVLLVGLCVAGLLLPTVQSRPAAGATICRNNLKQIGLALHNYHDTFGSFPPSYQADETGRPMHSWRVLILPFAEHSAMYDAYDFTQPWDSPANQAACAANLQFYTCPHEPTGTCSYFMVNVPDGIFDGQQAAKLEEITDGTSNTIMVVEVTGAKVHWSQPYDLGPQALAAGINSAADGTVISSPHIGGANVLLADGSVRFVDEKLKQQILQALITKSDGQTVELP